jgi:hypothetical protein
MWAQYFNKLLPNLLLHFRSYRFPRLARIYPLPLPSRRLLILWSHVLFHDSASKPLTSVVCKSCQSDNVCHVILHLHNPRSKLCRPVIQFYLVESIILRLWHLWSYNLWFYHRVSIWFRITILTTLSVCTYISLASLPFSGRLRSSSLVPPFTDYMIPYI